MPVTTREAVLQIAPELGEISAEDARWARFIADAEAMLSPTIWGSRLEMGARYYVAHLMTDSKRAKGGRGPVP